MTNTEIKKAFEQMKKDIAKESGIKYGFTMNKKQIEKRTATYCVCYGGSTYDEDIDYEIKSDMKVQTWDTWTDEEKHDHHLRMLERVKYFSVLESKYGTKQNQAKMTAQAIRNTQAFARFEEAIGNTVATMIEQDNEGFWRVRFFY